MFCTEREELSLSKSKLLLFVFTENESGICATADTHDVKKKNGTSRVDASQNSQHKPPNSFLNTHWTSDVQGLSRFSSQEHDRRPVNVTLTCHASAATQKPHFVSNNLNKFFQTSDLELTDADLEFNPK